jgi:hypothetical protein
MKNISSFFLFFFSLYSIDAFKVQKYDIHKLEKLIFCRYAGNIKNFQPSHSQMIRKRTLRVKSSETINEAISSAFNVATFAPQIPWLLMILLPNNLVTKKIMGGWTPILLYSLVHLFIVLKSISEPDGTAPLTEFAGVFDPSGYPLQSMMGMMKYPNFVSEEWSHVLVWDLFVGRLIWLDGIQKNIFTGHSVLLTNLIGPPGFLLHFLTCKLFRKEFMVTLTLMSSPLVEKYPEQQIAAVDTESIVSQSYSNIVDINGINKFMQICSENIEWENTNDAESYKGKSAVNDMLLKRAKSFPSSTSLIIDSITDGKSKTMGMMWYLADKALSGKGLRGITYFELNDENEIIYVREVSEPLYKPGSLVAGLLKAVAEKAVKQNPLLAVKKPSPELKVPTSASDLVTYLWKEVNGCDDKNMALNLFDDNILYEDFNFAKPFVGKEEVRGFLNEFDIPGITFIPEKISAGKTACSFTWRVEIAGVDKATRGISFYKTNKEGSKVIFIRDIAEPAIKPAPLQELAAIFNPSIRRFKPIN